MWVWRSLAVVLAASAASGAWAAEPEPSVSQPFPAPKRAAVITNPDWEHKPGPEDFSKYYPTGVDSTGVVIISCSVTDIGRLANCVVLSEFPEHKGFGEAALKISHFFQMKPKTIDGQPVAGGTFSTRIQFTYGAAPPRYLHPPTDAQLASVWPDKAKGQPAMVLLKCTITYKGRAEHCSVAKETPAGKGFGAAALKLAPQLAFMPARNGGSPVTSDAQFNLVFSLPTSRQTGVARFGEGSLALTNAPWRATPSAAEMRGAWPAAAAADIERGMAQLRCGFDADGALSGCTVFNEEPAKQGFGAAAMALADRFKLRDGAADPDSLPTMRITLPFTFANPKVGGQSPDRITQYNWIAFIDPDRMTSLYPAKASDAGVKTGRGVVDCVVAPDGALRGCAVSSEDPPGMDFGAAALAAIPSFATNPWTDDGRPAAGAKITVPIRFNESEPAPAPAAPPAAAAASAGAKGAGLP